ncbi:hypothetical protein KAJ27_17460, partial [bacterium]|nr:hypothetical protein [bacterium]
MKKRLKDIFKKLESKIRTVFVPDNYSGNELPLEEYYFSKKVPFTSICGKEASCQLNWIENAISCSPGLKIKAAGFSKDYSENWIKIDRIPYSTPIPSGNFDGIGIWLQTDGSGGNFHLSLTDPSGVEYTVSDNSALKIPGWRKLVYSFDEFKIADWSKKKSQEKMTSFINYSFSINLIPDKEKDVLKENLTIGKVFLIDAESPINSIDTVLSGFDFIPADFYRNSGFKYSELNIDNIDFFLFASSGDDSIINILPEQKKENANCTGIKVNYSINSNDHNCNHITIRSLKFHEIIDFNSFHGLIITIDNLTESCGELRFTIEDDSGNRASVSLYRVFNSKCVNRFYISRSRFILLDKPLKNISSYEFSISSHWNNIPIKNEFYLFPPDFISNNIKTESLNIPVVTSENLQPVQKIQEDCKVTAPLRKWWGLDRAAIFIEPTNLCNLRCIMCNHGNFSFKRPIGVMKFDNYKKILDEIDKLESNIWEIGPYWLGESFIHPQINQILSYTGNVKKHGNRFNNYTLHTNGILLEEKHFETLIES